jgi:hypothetical protein
MLALVVLLEIGLKVFSAAKRGGVVIATKD